MVYLKPSPCLLKVTFGHKYSDALESNYSGKPKEETNKITKDWLSISYLVAEYENIKIFIVGYKYNYKKKSERFKTNFVFACLCSILMLVLH